MKTNRKEARSLKLEVGITEGGPPCPPLARSILPEALRRGGFCAALRSACSPSSVYRRASRTAAFVAVLLTVSVAHAQYTADYQTNTYSGVSTSTNWGGNYVVGDTNHHVVLQVFGGAGLTNAAGTIGSAISASNNLAVVSGSGSLWTNTDVIIVGSSGFSNQLIITNGGRVVNTLGYIGLSVSASNNLAVVSGSNSLWSNTGDLFVGYSGSGNQLIITNGGRVVNTSGVLGFSASACNNLAAVGGSGSLWTNTANLFVGYSGSGNQLIITNSGRVVSAAGYVGYGAGANTNTVRIESGGLLDANSLIVAFADVNGASVGNCITNFGGIFQFSSATPTITTNAVFGLNNSSGSIILTNGTIAFRNIATADVKGNWSGSDLTHITFQGHNTFRLNAASNNTSGQDYVFDQGLGATNYVGLEMINGATAWRGGSLTIGSGGTMLVSNTAARIAGAVTNSGTMTVVNGSVVYGGNVVNLGAYVSDPSTNNFNGTFTVGPTATVVAASGDIYAFGGNLVMQSTNRAFNMSTAIAYFGNTNYGITTGTTNHTFDLSGSGAVDMGSNGFMSAVQLATNFSIGTLSIALSNNLTVTGTKTGSLTNALYVGWLDLTAWNTNASALSTTLSNALTLTDINLYYDAGDARNAYLQDASYALWGSGGLLIPIPEPSTAGLILGGALFSAWLLRRKGGRQEV